MKITTMILAIVLTAFLAIGCTQDGGQQVEIGEESEVETTELLEEDGHPEDSDEETSGVVVEVTIEDFKFDPAPIRISVGDTVTWTNFDSATHTATSNGAEFDSGYLKKGESFSFTFEQKGTFDYICTIHPYMEGTVIVE